MRNLEEAVEIRNMGQVNSFLTRLFSSIFPRYLQDTHAHIMILVLKELNN